MSAGLRRWHPGDKIRPVLQADHIIPQPAGGEHRLDNGLLRRSDVHTLYDRGYLAVDRRYRLLVSPRLRDEFGNGEQFYAHADQKISLPERRADQPRGDFLDWHLDYAFKTGLEGRGYVAHGANLCPPARRKVDP